MCIILGKPPDGQGTNMSEIIIHSLIHSLKDSLIALPFLFAAYFLLEFLEHRSEIKLARALSNEKIGPLGGAVVGCIPQCGMGVIASHLFSSGMISAGTLIAVFISTSDEALPVIFSHPDKIASVFPLLLSKIAAAVFAGYIFDFLFSRRRHKHVEIHHDHNSHGDCGNCENIKSLEDHHCETECGENIFISAIKRTLLIFFYIYVVTVVFGVLTEVIGEDAISSFLSKSYYLQPVFASIIGLIPNCAISVIITELYLSQTIGFGAVVAGLSTGAGIGYVTLFKTNKSIKEAISIVIYTLIFSIVFGEILQFLFI